MDDTSKFVVVVVSIVCGCAIATVAMACATAIEKARIENSCQKPKVMA